MLTPDDREVAQHAPDVDERLVLLEPESRPELLGDDPGRVAHRLRADALRQQCGLRRDELAGEERHDRQRDADAHQRPSDLEQRRAGHAHHGVLRARHELRQREQRADQRRHRERARTCATAAAIRRTAAPS